VTLNPSVRYQTILGWGKTAPWASCHPMLRDQVIAWAVNDFGINRLRFEGQNGNSASHGRSWEWLNDNDDPFVINWAAFNTQRIDERVREWLVPWKKAVEARGEKFDLYVSPSFFKNGSTGDLPPWMAQNSEEYAEWASALLLHLRDVHGITADYYCICNEAGNNNVFSPQVVVKMAKALVPRLRRLGFHTKIQFPESINAGAAWRYIQATETDEEFWQWVGCVSYHWYSSNNPEFMPLIRQFALAKNLPTAQTEFMNLTIDHLYDDMVLGGVSYWEIYGLGGPDYEAALSHISSTSLRGGQWYWRFRQVSHYVRPGSVRIDAVSDDAAVRCLAFEQAGRQTVVLLNTRQPAVSKQVVVKGLKEGRYGVSRCIGKAPVEEMGVSKVDSARQIAVSLPPDSVLTIYPRQENNLPPVVTEWRTQPDFLTLPASELQLRCSATDPDRDPLTFSWAVVSQPGGAGATVSQASSAVATAQNLSVAGDYIFHVSVSDGTHTVGRDVLVRVFSGNQPPVLNDVHNRIPVFVRVADGATVLRGSAWDIETDPLTYRWSVVSKPTGASPTLDTPQAQSCKVTGMTVAGDYVFQFEASDPSHTSSTQLTVPVYP